MIKTKNFKIEGINVTVNYDNRNRKKILISMTNKETAIQMHIPLKVFDKLVFSVKTIIKET